MGKRMLDKKHEPTLDEIKSTIGKQYALLEYLEDNLKQRYDLIKDLKFPFGNTYGWGYKYAHKAKHLTYVFFEENDITAMLQIGSKEAVIFEKDLDSYLPKTRVLWDDKYPCGEHGGWIQYTMKDKREVDEVLKILALRKNL